MRKYATHKYPEERIVDIREGRSIERIADRELLLRATFHGVNASPFADALLIFAHPDDEVIALGARLRHFQPLHLVHLTDGAPRDEADAHAHGFATWQEYHNARARELDSMLRVAGLQNVRYENWRIADQKAGLHLPFLISRAADLISAIRPRAIFTHPYEGGHPDHDACAFVVHQAVASLEADLQPQPRILEAAFYHAGERGIETGCFLPGQQTPELIYSLSPKEQAFKESLLQCFQSQQDTLQYFVMGEERFRIAPAYDFTRPPHAGSLFYERFTWGWNGKRLCQLASQVQYEVTLKAASSWR